MSAPANIPSIFDLSSMTALKSAAKRDDPAAVKTAAQQFEALFLQMMLKAMRDAAPSDGMFDSDQTRMYQQMLDQQMAQVMAAKGGTGLAAVIERQLTRSSDAPVEFEGGLPLAPPAKAFPLGKGAGALPTGNPDLQPARPLVPPLQQNSTAAPSVAPYAATSADASAVDAQGGVAANFIARLSPYAEQASQATGIPAQFLLAQAALETGWGRSEPRFADGRPSYNVFGIKAGRSWTGSTVDATTTEYVGGSPQRTSERFRAYGSYAEAFNDYAALLASNPRYAGLLGSRDAASFAYGLQRSGYATDPSYGTKLARIIAGMPRAA
ncbi:MAG TPA: flagellar assembly peptidoglycan hydrolase FlgJ [Rhodocyclaceae bacterium]